MSISSTSSSTSSSASPPLVVNGLVSGIDTTSVITALLDSYSQPITSLQNEQSSLNSTASDYQTLASDMQGVQSAAGALATVSKWNLMTATTSDSGVAAAIAAPGSQAGSMTFTVNHLAQANVLLSTGTVASEGADVTSQPSFLLATGAEALGLSGLSSSSLTLGSHSISVTQSSSAASLTGSALASSTVIATGSNDSLDLSVNGSPISLTLTAGTYSPSALAAAVNAAARTAGAPISASVNAAGELTIASSEQGSAATLAVTGGDALSSLGLSAATASGTDAVVNVDGTLTTLSAVNSDASVTLDAPTGTITAQIAGSPSASGSLLTTGSATAAQLSSGNGSFSGVMQAINNSGLGVTASAVEPTTGQYLLQVSANGTGLAGAASIDPNVFSGSTLGAMHEIASAQDASVSVGGTGGYTLTSSNDTFSSILEGTTVTVGSTGTATVSVAPDATATSAVIQTLVSAANQALGDIASLTAYNAATKTGGPLMGSAVVSSLEQQIQSIFATATGTSHLGNSADVGITLNANGSLSFSQSKFEQAFSANPSGVTAMFAQGGAFAPATSSAAGQASLLYAGATTASGSYDVSISQSAAQAIDTGAVLSGGVVSTPENLTIVSNGQSATYATSSGESLADLASGLNDAFSASGLGVTASVVDGGQQLQLSANDYGSAAAFSVTSDSSGSGTSGLGSGVAGVATSYAGLDVAGTINGVAATGNGQVLSAPTSDKTLNGLALDITASGISSATDLGSFTYSPGIAQQLSTLASEMGTVGSGALSSEVTGLQAEATGLNSSIVNYQALEASQKTLLQNEFATMETTLGSLKNQSSSITSVLTGIAANP